jgi:predicted enzyme related to lactoylglutathione lyase
MSSPALNLLVIRSPDVDRSARFYELLGLVFTKHAHGTGPQHYAAELGSAVFEIYPRTDEKDSTSRTRLGFRVANVDQTITKLQQSGAKIISPPKDTSFGRRAVVDDPDGHRIELTQ